MNRKLLAGAIGALAFAVSGCATVINGTNQPVEFESDPAGATVSLATGQSCTTPCAYELRRGNDNIVTISKAGYQTVEVFIQSRTGGGVAGNILAGGIIGGVVDASNGASNHLYPDPVSVRLVPTGQSGDAVLLDEDGEVISTVAAYNATVEEDVRQGMISQGTAAGSAEDDDD